MWRKRTVEPVAVAVAAILAGAALVVAVLLLSGCEGDRAAAASGSTDGAAPGHLGEAAAAARRCDWSGGGGTAPSASTRARVRSAFSDAGGGRVRLLLERSTVRPGTLLEVTVANDSSRLVGYGTYAYLADAEDGSKVPIDGPYGYPAIALYAGPGEVGPCVSIAVPTGAPSGPYRAVLAGIGSSRRDPGGTLGAEVEVAGEPVANPRWKPAAARG